MTIAFHVAGAVLALALIGTPRIALGSDTTHAADIVALKALIATFGTAYETRDLDAIMATFVESDDVAVFLPNPFAPMLIESRAGVRGVIATFFESIPRTGVIRMTTHDNSYAFHGDMALNWNYTNIYVNIGGVGYQYLARNTNVFARVGGVWRLLHIHGSPVPRAVPRDLTPLEPSWIR